MCKADDNNIINSGLQTKVFMKKYIHIVYTYLRQCKVWMKKINEWGEIECFKDALEIKW